MSIGGKTLGEFAQNPDGKTYDGRKVAQWLFEAVTGKPMSDEEAQRLVDEAQARAKARRKP
ncbi:hypothetical protein CLG96_02165 [Sphingomonas oleivorans]|uniref:Uncharacterized protein n=1 Tax=Sphingomonas oleivorans TaxID=1735121 RepID=A0A2T5G1I6_9SPHN|nr:hypothetical protein [Sphingomonas oleivorans]PTQ12970.1 hypothetical protein CLG96_02165 [Sphingomonas oleivorans]